MEPRAATVDPRYLKTADGTVYGPVDAVTLCAWAAEARVTPDCQISKDGEAWREATDIPELRLHWQTTLPNGTLVGPLNLFALWELMHDGSLPPGLSMRNRLTGAEVPLDERLLPVALRESRAILDAMAGCMAAGGAQVAGLSEREALRERLARAEKELADNLRLMSESQRLLAAREQQVKTMEARLAESQAAQSAERREFEARRAGPGPESSGTQALQAELVKAHAEADRLRIALERAQAAWAAEHETLTRPAPPAVDREQVAGRAQDRAEIDRLQAEQQRAEAAWLLEREALTRQAAEAAGRAQEAARAQGRVEADRLRSEHQRAEAAWAAERDALARQAAEAAERAQAAGSQGRAEVDRLRAEQAHAQSVWAAERESLTRCAAEASAQAREKGEAAAAAQVESAALTARLQVVQQEAQTQVDGMAARVDAMRQAAEALKADYENRLAEARQAVETAEGRGNAEREALDERLTAALRECADLTSVRDGLQATLSAAMAEQDAVGRRLQDVEGRRQAAADERDAARLRLAELDQALRDVTDREAAVRREMAASATHWASQDEAHEQAAAQWRQSAGEAEAAWKTEREALAQRLAGAERTVAEQEARLAGAAKERDSILAEASRNEASRQERADQRKREVEQTARHLGEIRAELAAARQALAAERERSGATEQRLMGEIKSLQRDLHALGMVKTASRKLRETPAITGSTIDWLTGAATAPSTAGAGSAPEDKFAGLDLPQQVDVLHQELKLSIDDKARLRNDLEKLRADYLALERLSETSGQELGAKLIQQQNELQSNAAVVRQTMEEFERRESAARQYRKRVEDREKELQDRISALEAELQRKEQAPPVVIQGEWEPPPRPAGTPPRDEPPPGKDAKGKPGVTALNSVEAQLRGELEKWHSLEQDKDRKKDKPQQWFRWKKS